MFEQIFTKSPRGRHLPREGILEKQKLGMGLVFCWKMYWWLQQLAVWPIILRITDWQVSMSKIMPCWMFQLRSRVVDSALVYSHMKCWSASEHMIKDWGLMFIVILKVDHLSRNRFLVLEFRSFFIVVWGVSGMGSIRWHLRSHGTVHAAPTYMSGFETQSCTEVSSRYFESWILAPPLNGVIVYEGMPSSHWLDPWICISNRLNWSTQLTAFALWSVDRTGVRRQQGQHPNMPDGDGNSTYPCTILPLFCHLQSSLDRWSGGARYVKCAQPNRYRGSWHVREAMNIWCKRDLYVYKGTRAKKVSCCWEGAVECIHFSDNGSLAWVWHRAKLLVWQNIMEPPYPHSYMSDRAFHTVQELLCLVSPLLAQIQYCKNCLVSNNINNSSTVARSTNDWL